MTDETLALLLESDHESAFESPPGFDHADAMQRVRSLQPKLEDITALELELDESVQDASHFTQLSVLQGDHQ